MAKYFYDCEFLEGRQKEQFPMSLFRKETKPTIDLISIGIVSEEQEVETLNTGRDWSIIKEFKSREYYAISKDFNLKEAWNRFDLEYRLVDAGRDKQNVKVYWIRENVLRPIFNELLERFNKDSIKSLNSNNYIGCIPNQKFRYDLLKFLINYYGKTNNQIAQEVFEFITQDEISLKKAKHYNVNYENIELYGYYSAYDHVVLCWLFGKMIDLPNGFPMNTIDLKQILDEQALKEVLENNQKENIEQVLNSWKRFDSYPKQENEHNSLADAKWNYELYKFLKSAEKEVKNKVKILGNTK